jgi:hypothetical protein
MQCAEIFYGFIFSRPTFHCIFIDALHKFQNKPFYIIILGFLFYCKVHHRITCHNNKETMLIKNLLHSNTKSKGNSTIQKQQKKSDFTVHTKTDYSCKR